MFLTSICFLWVRTQRNRRTPLAPLVSFILVTVDGVLLLKKSPIYVALLKTWSRLPVLHSFVLFQAAAFPQKKSLECSG
jgi:hypothetical protein